MTKKWNKTEKENLSQFLNELERYLCDINYISLEYKVENKDLITKDKHLDLMLKKLEAYNSKGFVLLENLRDHLKEKQDAISKPKKRNR